MSWSQSSWHSYLSAHALLLALQGKCTWLYVALLTRGTSDEFVFVRTAHILHRLIVFSVNTGIWTAIFALLTVILVRVVRCCPPYFWPTYFSCMPSPQMCSTACPVLQFVESTVTAFLPTWMAERILAMKQQHILAIRNYLPFQVCLTALWTIEIEEKQIWSLLHNRCVFTLQAGVANMCLSNGDCLARMFGIPRSDGVFGCRPVDATSESVGLMGFDHIGGLTWSILLT